MSSALTKPSTHRETSLEPELETINAADVSQSSMRWTVLAATRFVLATVVLVGHMSLFDPIGHSWTRFGTFLNQGSAVYGFLIISGYSIAASLERSERGYFVRRFWRIFPTYVASLLMAIIAGAFIVGSIQTPNGFVFYPPTKLDVLIALLMLNSYVAPTISTDGQLWTIAVEWWNYVLAPLYKRRSSIFLLALIAGSLIADRLFPPPPYPNDSTHGHMFVILSWYWIVGFLYHRHRLTPWGFAILFLPIMIGMANNVWVGRAAIIGVMAVALCEEISIPRRLVGAMNWLGELSYPIYAVHVPVIVICIQFHVLSPAIALVATLILSIAILHVVDLPLRKWGVGFSDRILHL
jgi:peptidoglycan/LPS O-acetylase OafA/YrhL